MWKNKKIYVSFLVLPFSVLLVILIFAIFLAPKLYLVTYHFTLFIIIDIFFLLNFEEIYRVHYNFFGLLLFTRFETMLGLVQRRFFLSFYIKCFFLLCTLYLPLGNVNTCKKRQRASPCCCTFYF